MVRHFITSHKQLVQLIVSLLIMLCTLTGAATPGGLVTKPVPKEPPWPLSCRLETSSTPGGLLY